MTTIASTLRSGLANRRPANEISRTISIIRAGFWACLAVILTLAPGVSAATASTAAVAAIATTILSSLNRERGPQTFMTIEVVVDSVTAGLLMAELGLNPFSAVMPVGIILESVFLLGIRATGAFTAALSVPAYLLLGGKLGSPWFALALVLPASIGIFWLSSRLASRKQPSTLFKRRTLEEVDSQLEAVFEENQRLRGTYLDLLAAAREKIERCDWLESQAEFVANCAFPRGLEPCFQQIVQSVCEDLNVGACALWLLDDVSNSCDLTAASNDIRPILDRSAIQQACTLIPTELRNRCLDKLKAATADLCPTPKSGSSYTHVDSSVGLALRSKGKLVGVLGVAVPLDGQSGTQIASELGERGSTLAVAIQIARMREDLARANRELKVTQQLMSIVQQSSSLDSLYQSAVRLIADAVNCQNCTIFLYDEGAKRLVPKQTVGEPVNVIDHIIFDEGNGVSGWVARERKPLVIQDLSLHERLINLELIPARVRTFVSIPLCSRGQLLGVINVSHSEPNALGQVDIRLLHTISIQIATAIERGEVVRSLEQIAITDGLTHLYNHRYFRMRLEQEISRANRYREPVTVMMIDIDRFKSINDQFGHGVGDAALADVSAVVRRSVRDTDIPARYGGDELAVILTHTTPDEAVAAAERIRRTIELQPIHAPDGSEVPITVSVGLASMGPGQRQPEDVIRRADEALYHAKQAGRNQVMVQRT